MFTGGNNNSQVAESKYVNHRKLCASLQLPIGDDVSAYIRCEAARPSAIAADDGRQGE
jgi:hypothetical protein